jgi:hypothetical protein
MQTLVGLEIEIVPTERGFSYPREWGEMLMLARRFVRRGLPGAGREDRRAACHGRRAVVQRRARGIGVGGVDWGVYGWWRSGLSRRVTISLKDYIFTFR